VPDTALLVMDVQRAIVERYPDPDYLPRLGKAATAARSAGLPVIYVVVGFRPGHPEISPNNKVFAAARASNTGFTPGDPNAEIHPDVAPLDSDIIVTKRRVSAFAGSDLDLVLRSQAITSLVLTGIATSGVVLSTLRQAADLDFRLTVLDDACLDADPEVHTVLTTKVFPRQADVLSVDNWMASL
jgi:nicotinamidase-related amidase